MPLPGVVHADLSRTQFPDPFVIFERLPGVDLGDVYLDLSSAQKRTAAHEMVRISDIVASLPRGSAFGFGVEEAAATLRPTWRAVLEDLIARAESRFSIDDQTLFKTANHVCEAVSAAREALVAIEPRPFLHDTTTKNVIFNDGCLSGIVDVDDLCFGDQLLTPALTWASLLSRGWPTDYVESYWSDAFATDDAGKRRLRLHTACLCIDLLGELGQTFGDKIVPMNHIERARLLEAVSRLLD